MKKGHSPPAFVKYIVLSFEITIRLCHQGRARPWPQAAQHGMLEIAVRQAVPLPARPMSASNAVLAALACTACRRSTLASSRTTI